MDRDEFMSCVGEGSYVRAVLLVRLLCGYGNRVARKTLQEKLKSPMMSGVETKQAADNTLLLTTEGAAKLILKLPEGSRGELNAAGKIQVACAAFLTAAFGGSPHEQQSALARLSQVGKTRALQCMRKHSAAAMVWELLIWSDAMVRLKDRKTEAPEVAAELKITPAFFANAFLCMAWGLLRRLGQAPPAQACVDADLCETISHRKLGGLTWQCGRMSLP